MLAFAANSWLCRLALQDPANRALAFTAVRLISGACTLWLISRFLRRAKHGTGNWRSATALFVYAVAFSLAYVELTTATGALLLFAAVQATMIGYGLWSGERLVVRQQAALVLAFTGFVYLLWPGLTAPPWLGSTLMISAGVAWGVYSIRGRSGGDPTWATAGNFVRASVLVLPLVAIYVADTRLSAPQRLLQMLTPAGYSYAILSGGLASGIGYALWYAALPQLKAVTAASVQLSVPVIASLGGICLLGEPFSLRLALSSVAILGGIYLFLPKRNRQG